MAEIERRHLLSVLQETYCNVVTAARILGLHRNTLTRRIEQYDLHKA
jgi:DNA-binding protein Fis